MYLAFSAQLESIALNNQPSSSYSESNYLWQPVDKRTGREIQRKGILAPILWFVLKLRKLSSVRDWLFNYKSIVISSVSLSLSPSTEWVLFFIIILANDLNYYSIVFPRNFLSNGPRGALISKLRCQKVWIRITWFPIMWAGRTKQTHGWD